MPPVLNGLLAGVLLVINTLFWFIPLMTAAVIKLLLPIDRLRRPLSRFVIWCAESWIRGNNAWMALTQPMQWRVERPDNLNPQGWYMVVSNHQSWVDILVLQYALGGRIPFLKFFLKKELIWVPFMGLAWWALDLPFMKRYSKAYLEKHPEKRGQDLETTRRSCEKFRDIPTSVMNFLEGTRFTPAKHEQQQSSYQHLLKPKSGGLAFAMSVMNDRFHSLVDVTIHYPGGIPTFIDFLQGKMTACHVIVKEYPIPEDLQSGDYQNDDQYRLQFQQWVQQIWEEKDATLAQLETKDARHDHIDSRS
ncbi:MAG: acyltransferase [Oceanobacter sp.]